MRSKLIFFGIFIAVVAAILYIPGAADFTQRFGHALFYNPVTAVIGGILLAPGVLVVLLLWRVMLRQLSIPWDQATNPVIGPIVMIFIVVFSWVFWSTSISRTLKFIGIWNPFGSSIYGSRPVILRAIVFVGGWWEILTRFGRQATGGWAGFFEVLSCRFKDGDIFLGRPRFKIGGGMLRPIGVPTEKHIVTIAGTGAGKSTGALIPNLCLHRGSLLCVDPKGELARITAARRGQGGGGVRGMGQDVYVLDPFRITGIASASYNVFDEMARVAQRDVDAPVSYAAKIAESLVEITGRDPFWDTAARRVVLGLILYVFQGPAEKRNLVQVRRLLMEGDKDAFEAGVREGHIDPKKNDAFDALLIGMRHVAPGPYRDTIVFSAESVMQMAPNQRGSVMTTAQEHTSFLDLPEIRRVSQSSDFLLEDLKNRPISVYLSVPINMVSGVAGRWLRMFVLMLIDMMMRVQVAPKPPILLAVDEFPNLGKLDGIEVVAPVLRSYGVRFWAVGQDIEQFKKTYPKSWGSFIGGAEAVQFMGIKHPETVKMVVEFLGRHLITRREGEGQFRRNVAEERNLLDANQVSQILYKARKNQIVWRGDRRPLILKATPYFEYMPWWYYSRDTRYPEAWNRWLWRSGKWRRNRLPTYDDPSSWPAFVPPLPPPKRPLLPPVKPPSRPALELPPEDDDVLPTYDNPASWDRFTPPKPAQFIRGDDPSRPSADLMTLTASPELRSSEMFPKPPVRQPLPREILELLNPTKTPGQSELDPIDELDGMIGLESVKTQVKKTVSLVRLGRERAAAGLPKLEITHHLVFTGNPGTGKTTVARIIGRIYKKAGLLKSGHLVEVDRGDLVAGYIGQTAPQVKTVVERATDGVLFIDEAYSLAGGKGVDDDYGAEAISALLKLMEDRRDRLVVIAAGYRAEMVDFINSNPGLKSRFRTYIDFPDYSPTELMEILQSLCVAASCRMSMDAMKKAAEVLVRIDPGQGFGNGRAVRNLLDECFARQAMRLNTRGRYGAQDMTIIEAEDVPAFDELKM